HHSGRRDPRSSWEQPRSRRRRARPRHRSEQRWLEPRAVGRSCCAYKLMRRTLVFGGACCSLRLLHTDPAHEVEEDAARLASERDGSQAEEQRWDIAPPFAELDVVQARDAEDCPC